MNRLISEQNVIDAVSEWLYDKTRKESIETVIKAIPSAEPYKGMTNGEVVKTIFDVDEIQVTENTVIVRVKGSFCAKMQFLLDWWNSPYEPQESEV